MNDMILHLECLKLEVRSKVHRPPGGQPVPTIVDTPRDSAYSEVSK